MLLHRPNLTRFCQVCIVVLSSITLSKSLASAAVDPVAVGSKKCEPGSIVVHTFLDVELDGQFVNEEDGLADWQVFVRDGNFQTVLEKVGETGRNGFYTIDNTACADLRVCVRPPVGEDVSDVYVDFTRDGSGQNVPACGSGGDTSAAVQRACDANDYVRNPGYSGIVFRRGGNRKIFPLGEADDPGTYCYIVKYDEDYAPRGSSGDLKAFLEFAFVPKRKLFPSILRDGSADPIEGRTITATQGSETASVTTGPNGFWPGGITDIVDGGIFDLYEEITICVDDDTSSSSGTTIGNSIRVDGGCYTVDPDDDYYVQFNKRGQRANIIFTNAGSY